jgi:hypothetical protein
MRTLILVALLIFYLPVYAESNPPTPAPSKKSTEPKANTAQHQQHTKEDKRGTKDFPAIIEITRAPTIQVEAIDRTEKGRDYASPEWGLVYITGLLAMITLGLAFYTARLWKATRKLVESTDDATRRIQRAYIRMSYANPGLSFISDILEERIIVNVEIKNCGETPAVITEIFLKYSVLRDTENMPAVPDYYFTEERNKIDTFLVKGDWFFTLFSVPIKKIGENVSLIAIKKGEIRLVMFGYVDYVDIFGQKHRYGFAREYYPGVDRYGSASAPADRNNMGFLIQNGYNYDRTENEQNR